MTYCFKFFPVFLLTALFLTSCSHSDDAGGEEKFLGRYEGQVRYSADQGQNFTEAVSAYVSNENENWVFSFDGDIPEIDSILFNTNEDGEVMMNVNADSIHLIRITPHTLQIDYSSGSRVWQAHCVRN